MASWTTCLDIDQTLISHHQLPSPRGDLHSTLRDDLAKIFHDNNLDLLANACDIGFSDTTTAGTQTSSTDKEGNTSFPEAAMSLLKAEHKLDFISVPDMFAQNTCSPAKSLNFKEDGVHTMSYGHGSPYMFSDRGEIASKENYFYPYHLRSDQQPNFKNFADFQENPNNFFNDYDEESLSLMWNELSSNTPKPKQLHGFTSSHEKVPRPLKLDFEYSEFGDDDTLPMHDFKIKQSPFSKLEDDLSKLFARKTNSSRSGFLEDLPEHYYDSTLDTQPVVSQDISKMARGNTVDYSSSTLLRRKNGYPDFEEFEDPYNDMKGRSSRGLRVLSLRVKDVVRMKNKTSYKEVADFLTQEVSLRMKAAQGEARDDQNVKRRVYDALNVLIAADILKKEGKVVYCGEDIDNIGIDKRRRLAYEAERLNRKTAIAKKKLKNKQRALQELVFKFLAVKNLVKRNKETHNMIPIGNGQGEEKKIMGKKENQATTTTGKIMVEEGKTVKFPFIIVPSLAEDTTNVRMNRGKTNMLVESKNPINILGDTDILLKLKLHYVSKDFFSEVLLEDIHKYVPSLYLDTLK